MHSPPRGRQLDGVCAQRAGVQHVPHLRVAAGQPGAGAQLHQAGRRKLRAVRQSAGHVLAGAERGVAAQRRAVRLPGALLRVDRHPAVQRAHAGRGHGAGDAGGAFGARQPRGGAGAEPRHRRARHAGHVRRLLRRLHRLLQRHLALQHTKQLVGQAHCHRGAHRGHGAGAALEARDGGQCGRGVPVRRPRHGAAAAQRRLALAKRGVGHERNIRPHPAAVFRRPVGLQRQPSHARGRHVDEAYAAVPDVLCERHRERRHACAGRERAAGAPLRQPDQLRRLAVPVWRLRLRRRVALCHDIPFVPEKPNQLPLAHRQVLPERRVALRHRQQHMGKGAPPRPLCVCFACSR